MALSSDQAGKLQGYIAILEDRCLNVCLDVERMYEHPLTDDDLNALADRCIEIQEAALAIELLFARAVRWGQGASADEADLNDTTNTDVQPDAGPSGAGV